MKTIVISNQPGQLANQLIVYANFIAFCHEHGFTLKNPSFHRYSSYFEFTKHSHQSKITYKVINYLMRFIYRFRLGNRIINVVNIGFERKIDLDDPTTLFLFSDEVLLVAGWQFRGNQTVLKHKKLILEKFTPVAKHKLVINDFFAKNEMIGRCVIGIHVRRGDYEKFEGGKYFYDFSVYKNVLSRLDTLFKDKHPIFLICSNEPGYEKYFCPNEYPIVFGPNHELQDLYCLAKCNYLIGPPSTYTMWASFIGDIPLYMMRDSSLKFVEDDFKIINGF